MDMSEAKERLLEAVRKGETIVMFGEAIKASVSPEGDVYKVEVTGFHPKGFPHWDEGTSVASWEGPEVDEAAKRVVDALAGIPARMMQERGQGKGVGGPPQGDGGADQCICPECGATAAHEKGTPCNETKCPKCGAAMQGASTVEKQYKPPPGWDDPQSWLKSGEGAEKVRRAAWAAMGGSFTGCVSHMEGRVDDTSRFCGALKAAVLGYGPRYGKELMSYIEAEVQGWAAVEKVIVDEGSEVVLYSKDKSRVLGRYPYGKGKKYKDKEAATKAAEEREREVQFFKHQEEGFDEWFKEIGLVPFFESRLHLLSTMLADQLYGAGKIDKQMRLKLSDAIGQALDAYSVAMSDTPPVALDGGDAFSGDLVPPPHAGFWKEEPTARMFLAAAKAYLQRKKSEAVVWRDGDRRFYLGLISLPSIRDKEDEVVTMEGADLSIAISKECGYHSGLYVKHIVPQSLVGRSLAERRIGPFWVEFGEFKNTLLADFVFRALENDKEGKWKFSIGFITPKKQALAGRYTRLLKFDSTITEVPAQSRTAMLALVRKEKEGGTTMGSAQDIQKILTLINPEEGERDQVTRMLSELFEIEEKEVVAIAKQSEDVAKAKEAIEGLEDEGLKGALLEAIAKAEPPPPKKKKKKKDEEEEEDEEEEAAAKELKEMVKDLTTRLEAVEASAGSAALQELRQALLTRSKDYPKPSETAEPVADGAEILAKLEKMLNPQSVGKHPLAGFAGGPSSAEGG